MHVSVAAKDGAAVSLTSTINLTFGAKLIDPSTGIFLNNEMDDFSIPGAANYFGLPPSPYNYIGPYKRPLSSSVPTMLEEDGALHLVIGASGGSRIISATLQCILNILDRGMNVAQGIVDPNRMHHQLLPNEVVVEATFSTELEAALKAKNHTVHRLRPQRYHSAVSVSFIIV